MNINQSICERSEIRKVRSVFQFCITPTHTPNLLAGRESYGGKEIDFQDYLQCWETLRRGSLLEYVAASVQRTNECLLVSRFFRCFRRVFFVFYRSLDLFVYLRDTFDEGNDEKRGKYDTERGSMNITSQALDIEGSHKTGFIDGGTISLPNIPGNARE